MSLYTHELAIVFYIDGTFKASEPKLLPIRWRCRGANRRFRKRLLRAIELVVNNSHESYMETI
jgi:hypothetical protein